MSCADDNPHSSTLANRLRLRASPIIDLSQASLSLVAAVLIPIGIFSTPWNVVIGGPLFSKSLRGLTVYKMDLLGLEGLFKSVLLLLAPFVLLYFLVKTLPPWKEGASQSLVDIPRAAVSLLFVAGQVGWDETGRIVSSDIVGQFDKALSNVLAVVRQAGGEPASIVRLTLYVLDRREYRANMKPLGEAYRSQMGKHYPAMT